MTIDIRDYDLATFYRFKLFFDNCHWYNSPNLPITTIRNEKIYKGERIEFPLLALRRVAAPIMYKDAQNSWAVGITGDRRGRDISVAPDMKVSSVDMTMVQTNYELKYMLDIFSFERDNFDELVVEVQENLFRYPYLTFENWKNKDLNMRDPQVAGMSTNIVWESTEDNTDLESFNSQTPFYRATVTFTIRAYIYRKYAALLLEELINGYRILDYKKVTQQVVDSDIPVVPPEPDPRPTPEYTNTYSFLTTYNVAEFNKIGSIGLFLFSNSTQVYFYGDVVEGSKLKPVSFNIPQSGFFSYTTIKANVTGKWKLMSSASLGETLVLALKISEEEDNIELTDIVEI